ncbi:dUTP diphosphatase [Alicyclobacillaceae bacterium I2511]|nr:dUTP diphosphatase [Alicyclobacillaceae bacterium I2511]
MLVEAHIDVKIMTLSALCVGASYPPEYATEGSAGVDLRACVYEPIELAPGERVRVPTGIAVQMPPGVVGMVFARSGLAWNYGIGLPNGVGVIDSDYTGEIQVLLMNFATASYSIHPQDRIAQIVFLPVYTARWLSVTQLFATARGVGGFGSTGKN